MQGKQRSRSYKLGDHQNFPRCGRRGKSATPHRNIFVAVWKSDPQHRRTHYCERENGVPWSTRLRHPPHRPTTIERMSCLYSRSPCCMISHFVSFIWYWCFPSRRHMRYLYSIAISDGLMWCGIPRIHQNGSSSIGKMLPLRLRRPEVP